MMQDEHVKLNQEVPRQK